MMTKSDYEMIANILRDNKAAYDLNHFEYGRGFEAGQHLMLVGIAADLLSAFSATDPNFSAEEFLDTAELN